MATVPLIPYDEAKPEARAVYDNIMQTRKVNDVNNFWKALAHSPDLLKHVWERAQEVMKPQVGLSKDVIYFVFPDRYRNGDASNDLSGGKTSDPT